MLKVLCLISQNFINKFLKHEYVFLEKICDVFWYLFDTNNFMQNFLWRIFRKIAENSLRINKKKRRDEKKIKVF